jgi:hypothetical protein
MRVFLSWSKEPSKSVALALRVWLKRVIQSLDPFMSEIDIEAGARGYDKIAESLAGTSFGIICVTSENQAQPWINFEAGALGKTFKDDWTRVCPYLIGMGHPSELKGPLSQFQAKLANEEGTFDLLKTINSKIEKPLPESTLKEDFDLRWLGLDAAIKDAVGKAAMVNAAPAKPRDPADMLAEVLETVRGIARTMDRPAPQAPFWGGTFPGGTWGTADINRGAGAVDPIAPQLANAPVAGFPPFGPGTMGEMRPDPFQGRSSRDVDSRSGTPDSDAGRGQR